ncbi:hypothetical protein [uncultured Chryseobacterium sp.]|uniref:hypothetical protein n=1 Tax=uncultured Chryseobacterium sp. TaxID=259322 RepID=UPI0025DFACE1|nr:hypothetical protein [uncultured Chryseobacterium sp.]
MLNKSLLLFFLSFALVINNCQKKNSKSTMIADETTTDKEEKLIDRLTIDNSVFPKDDIDLRKYKYNSTYIEDVKISDLMNVQYREKFIKYLKEIKTEDDEFKSTLVSQLLYLRTRQLSDNEAFYILSELSKDDFIAYNGIELYPEKIVKFFIENPLFFIRQGTKYHEVTLLNLIIQHLDDFFVQESFFADYLGEINMQPGQLFIFPEKEIEFDESFRQSLSEFNTQECIFSPSLYTGWQNKTINFTDISPVFGEALIKKLTLSEKNYFNQYIKLTLKKYIISINNNYKTAIIQDSDGFTNLRTEKNTTSAIRQKISSGETVEVLENTGD